MKKLLLSSLMLMSVSSIFTIQPRGVAARVVTPVVASAPTVVAPVAPTAPIVTSLADQIKAILAQITPGLAAVKDRSDYIKNAFSALETGIQGQDLATIDTTIKKGLSDSCDWISAEAQNLINELDPNGYPYWIKAPKSSTVKEMLELQEKVNNCKELIEGPGAIKMLMKPVKYIGNHKANTAKTLFVLWALNKAGVFKYGPSAAYNYGVPVLTFTKDLLFKSAF